MKSFIMSIVTCAMVLFLLSGSTPLFSADIGLKLGPQRSNFDRGGYDLTRFKVGLFYSMNLSKNLSFQPELYYSQLGVNEVQYNVLAYNDGEVAYVYNVQDISKLSYIELPVILKYKLPLKGELKPVLMAGIYGAMRISRGRSNTFWDFSQVSSQGAEVDYGSVIYEEIQSLDYENLNQSYSDIDAGFVLGFGIEHGVGKTRLLFDIRTNIGVTNIYAKNSDPNHINPPKRRTSSLTFMVGLSF